MGDLKELTDAQLAAIAERNIDPWNWYIARSDIPALLDHSTALAARLAEAQATIEQRVATIHGLSTIIDGHEAETEDLAQRCDKATAQLAAAQATIARLTEALGIVESLCAARAQYQEMIDAGTIWRIAQRALAPPAPEADDAR